MNDSQLRVLLELDRSTIPSDGGDRYNRLIFARSPYLLQHAENPTDWQEWGIEAFTEAKRRNVPLFVSIGYSSCHWCHVMALESFADQEVAKVLNSHYVPVKVDREERPDLDDFYMSASRLLTGNSGWPLNVFVDHERKPFFAVTYLPKQPRDGVPGLISLLQNINVLWREQQLMVARNASEISRSLLEMAAIPVGSGLHVKDLVSAGFDHLRRLFDREHTGIGTGPKFPLPGNLLFLLSRCCADFSRARDMALQTLRVMARGGINDQLAGGFHRYAVDRQWLVPHFEKMLYDQAMLIEAYTEGYRTCGDPLFLDIARSIARFTLTEMANPEGGFCSALDADSEGEEGRFYTWAPEEIDRAMGEDGPLCRDYWGVTEQGHVGGRSVLHLPYDTQRFAADHDMEEPELTIRIKKARVRLLAFRSERERPMRDQKVICAWNGLMITALVRLARLSGDVELFAAAEKAAEFIITRMMTPDGRLVRNWLGKPSLIAAFAEDYACFCLGLAELAETSCDSHRWREELRLFGMDLQRLFVDKDGTVHVAGRDSERLPVDIPPLYDSVTPSAAAVTAAVCIRMAKIFADPESAACARRIIQGCRGVMERNPAACLSLLITEKELEDVDEIGSYRSTK